jgi:hypothetical protein
MTIKPRPVRKTGSKNIFCPRYESCLDHAVNNSWPYFSCSHCPYRDAKQSMTESHYVNHQEFPYYNLPSSVGKVIVQIE